MPSNYFINGDRFVHNMREEAKGMGYHYSIQVIGFIE
jgi:hypothetical protein